MNEHNYLDTLPEKERTALAICGISKDNQLRRISLSNVLADAKLAAENFPEEMAALSEQRIKEIYQTCNQEEGTDLEETRSASSVKVSDIAQRQIPALILARRGSSKRSRNASTPRTSAELHNKAHCIHCARPLKVYFSAWFTLLFYLDLLAWIVLPILFLLELLPEVPAMIIIASLVAGILPFILVARRANCAVCNLNIFMLRRFSESQYAHKFPLLNRNVSTALHIILFLWYRCPGCGTPQHLMRRRRHR